MNKYIEDLGVKFKDTPDSWVDKTNKKIINQREIYGFDESETWSLDTTFAIWLYSRVKMFKEKASNMIKLDFHKFLIDGKEYTQIEVIDQILANTGEYLTSGTNTDDLNKLVKATELFAKILPAMWW